MTSFALCSGLPASTSSRAISASRSSTLRCRVKRKTEMIPLTQRVGGKLAIAVAICLFFGGAHAYAGESEITIDNFTFSPPELTVKVGSTVTWKNHDDIPHTVVSAGKFRSKTMDTDGSFSFTFTAAGSYTYFCSLHPHMTGMIKVE